MTPKLQGALQALKMLQHNVESDADEVVARVSELDARRKAAKDRTHATLSAAGSSLGEIEEFVAGLEGDNGAPEPEPKKPEPPHSW